MTTGQKKQHWDKIKNWQTGQKKHGSEWDNYVKKGVREGGVKAGVGPKSETRGGRRVGSPCGAEGWGAEGGALDLGQFEKGQRVFPTAGQFDLGQRKSCGLCNSGGRALTVGAQNPLSVGALSVGGPVGGGPEWWGALWVRPRSLGPRRVGRRRVGSWMVGPRRVGAQT